MMRVIKRDANGVMQVSYEGRVVARGEGWVCVDARFGFADMDLGYVVLRKGDLFREWFFANRWYNIFRVTDARGGTLRGWYCNITRPAIIAEEIIEADDLALDVFVKPDGDTLILDQEEFEELDLSAQERWAACRAVSELQRLVEHRIAPFDEIA